MSSRLVLSRHFVGACAGIKKEGQWAEAVFAARKQLAGRPRRFHQDCSAAAEDLKKAGEPPGF